MKKPDLKQLQPAATPTTKAKPAPTSKAKSVRKTFSVEQSHLDHINAMAVKLGQDKGVIVNASEALRAIIEQHKGQS